MSRRSRSYWVAGGAGLLLATGALALLASNETEQPPSDDDPLSFGYELRVVVRPIEGPTAFVFEACSPTGPQEITLVSAAPVTVTGGDAEIRIDWVDTDPSPVGAGSVADLPTTFAPLPSDDTGDTGGVTPPATTADTTGTVGPCGTSPTLEFAAVLSPATRTDVAVERVSVSYTADGEPYTTIAPVTFVSCATGTKAESLCDD